MDETKLKKALLALDPKNDKQWTAEGLPSLDALKFMVGQAVTREQVGKVAAGFTRESPTFKEAAVTETKDGVLASKDTTPPTAAELGVDNVGTGDDETQSESADERPTDAELEEAKAALVEATARKVQADKAHQEATEAVDKILDARGNAEDDPFHVAIQGYQKAAQKDREEQARRKEAMKNIDLADFLPHQEPIDKAYATRKRQVPTVTKK